MTRLIKTRCGAVLYAVVTPLIPLLLVMPMFMPGSAVIWSNPFNPLPFGRPVLLGLAAYMGFALCAWAVLIGWRCRSRKGRNMLVTGLQCLLLWFTAVPGALVLYLLNLLWLLRGKYPDRPWSSRQWVRMIPVGCAVVILLLAGIKQVDRAPAATPEEVFRQYRITSPILAQLPQEDGSVLLISFDGCGIVAQEEEGWLLREAWQKETSVLEHGQYSEFTCISRSTTGDMDAVVVMRVAAPLVDAALPDMPPRDSVGSAFVHTAADETTSYYYTLVDVDTPGYELIPS